MRPLKNYRNITAFSLVAALAAVSLTVGAVLSQSGNGEYDTDGDGLIEVSNLEQLNAIRYDLDGDGQSDNETYANAFPLDRGGEICETGCLGYELTRSLNFRSSPSYASGSVNNLWTKGSGWLPIGIRENLFNATLEGNGHTISNLYIKRVTDLDDPGQAGLFGMIGDSAIIQNLGLDQAEITALRWVGGFAGKSDGGALISCSATGKMETVGSGGGIVGGLVGYNRRGAITGSFFRGTLSGAEDSQVGGIAGHHAGVITSSHADVEATGGENSYVGGLIGYGSAISRVPGTGVIKDSYSSGRVSGKAFVGGLAGEFSGAISGSHSTATVSGVVPGGLIGNNLGTTSGSYATGEVSGEDYGRGGGFAGDNHGTIIGSYATGDVSGMRSGGLVGWKENALGSLPVSPPGASRAPCAPAGWPEPTREPSSPVIPRGASLAENRLVVWSVLTMEWSAPAIPSGRHREMGASAGSSEAMLAQP